jgi:hypothetical protein
MIEDISRARRRWLALRVGACKRYPAFCLAVAGLFLYSTAGHAATTVSATCSESDVQKALNSARSGDTVIIPGPCSPIWSSGVTIENTRGVTLAAAGGTISISGAPAVTIHQNASVSTRVTGLTFTSVGQSSHPTILVLGDFLPPSATARIDHNTFRSTSSGTWIEMGGGAAVLVDHNSLSAGGAAEMIHNVAFGPADGIRIGWTTDVVPGSADMVFIEDNTFTCTDPTFVCNIVQSYYGARTVVRHNTSNFSQVDQHGTRGMPWARWWEIYENTFFTHGLSQCCFMELRGGSGVVWGNIHKDTNKVNGGIGVQVEEAGCSGKYPSSSYPVTGQIGRGIKQAASPAYFWNNSADMPVLAVQGTACLSQGTDYSVSASQPATLLRCESAADRKAGCPVSYKYTPYTYPFPLDGNGLPNPAAGSHGLVSSESFCPFPGAFLSRTCENQDSVDDKND